MSGVTSIDSLPTDPSVSSNSSVPVQNNVKLEVNEKQHVSFSDDTKSNDGGSMPSIVQQKTINNLVSGIQQAAAAVVQRST